MCSIWSIALPQTEHLPDYSSAMYLYIVILVAMIIFQQSCYSKSMQYNTVGVVSVLNYMAIPLGYLLDWAIIGESFDSLELVGAGIIFGINIVIATLRIRGQID